MVSFENSVSSYNDDSNLSGREDTNTNLSSHEEESDIENYLDIQPPPASTKTLTKHELHTKSSHDRHKKHKRDYDKRRRRKENTKLMDNGETVKYSAGRYYKEQVCMEDFLGHNRCISNKEEYSGGIHRSEDIYMNRPTKHSSSKHPYENDEDDRRSKRHKKNKYKESENINCVLQGKKIEFINESKNVNTDDNFENYSGITGNSEFAENDTQASRIERLLKAENELETLQKCRQYIKHALKNQEQISEIETLDETTVLDQSEDQLQANDREDVKTPSPTSEDAAEGKSVITDNVSPHLPEHITIFHISPKNEIECESSQVNDISPISDLPPYYPAIHGCRSVNEFHILNHINEGTYGVVYRAKDKLTREIVALKRLKMEKENEGFPVTSLREINTLMKGQHPNIVTVREIVMGSNMDKIFIVMDYIEHDLKSLIEMMRHKKQSFTAEEVKCLLKQLLCAVAHLHDNWILHRDLKTSNLLLSHNGILKVGDFGLAREYGSPLKAYTPLVVTLWYRAPELILGAKQYSTAIDMWSVGCIFGELVHMNPIFQGKSEVDQLFKVFKILGTPNETIWPGFNKFPAVQHMKITKYPVPNLRTKFHMLTVRGQALLEQLLTYDPTQRISGEDALQHPYFKEFPLPIDPSMFPKWPAKSELDYGRTKGTSHTTKGYKRPDNKIDEDALGFRINAPATENRRLPTGGGFSLKF